MAAVAFGERSSAGRARGRLCARPRLGRVLRSVVFSSAALPLLSFFAAGARAQPPQTQGPTPLAPPSTMQVDNAPPVSQTLARDIAPYGEFNATRFIGWHPLNPEMLVMRRAGNTQQLFLLTDAMGKLQQLTHGREPVRAAQFEPRRGDYVLLSRDSGGDEATQLFRLDLKSLKETALTPAGEQFSVGPWNTARDKVIITARPLDRQGKRDQATLEVFAIDPLQPEARFRLATLTGAGWRALRWFDRENRILLSETVSATRSRVWSMDLGTGKRTELGDADAGQESIGDRDRWLYRRRFDGEFAKLSRVDLRNGERQWVTRDIEADVDDWSVSTAGQRIAVLTNTLGGSQLRLFDTSSMKPLAVPALPAGLITAASWHRNGRDLALSVESADSPGEVFVLDTDLGMVTRWTYPATVSGVKRPFTEAEPVSWRSFDGLVITGFMHRPNPREFPGKRPVIIAMHGGPEGQARPGFRGRVNYWINELGYAVIYPNVRGSAGFGRRFLEADNQKKREDSVRDIGALLDWIHAQPHLDPARVAVMGSSYGGYMVLASGVMYGPRIAAACSSFGISHFVTMLENTETWRRDLRRSEYGDERDPDMRRFLDGISPLTHADRIRIPLMVTHGKNDPRVPVSEAEQIVKKVRANGTTVTYLLAEDEGHGFTKKVNADYQFAVQTAFLERYIGKRTAERSEPRGTQRVSAAL